ncbi:hypothetical protein MNBD_GAMMA22-2905 [hydrothermal vent metagenome]|uniref:DUF805 domain-containing protein n=1 Tax=hydrothermal vent metagenome TaxID=652676 RepID=A0A3B1ADM6_9ZZZZ
MSEANQYQAPSSNVETAPSTEYGTVNWLSASGRLGRIRYIAYSFGLSFAAMIVIGIAMALFGAGLSMFAGGGEAANAGMGIGAMVFMLVIGVLYIGVIVVSIMLVIQRVHDFNASGWLCLLYFVPLVNLVFFLLLIFLPGTDGENQYGLKTPPNGASTIIVILIALLIPVMGILAAISIPAYQGYVEAARQAQMEQSH